MLIVEKWEMEVNKYCACECSMKEEVLLICPVTNYLPKLTAHEAGTSLHVFCVVLIELFFAR
jgi:hypothetical protein